MSRNNYESFEKSILENHKKGETTVITGKLPASTCAYFKKKFSEKHPDVFSDLNFAGGKSKKTDGQKSDNKEKGMRFTLDPKSPKPEENPKHDKQLRAIHGLGEEVKTARSMAERAIGEKEKALRIVEDLRTKIVNMESEAELHKKSLNESRAEISRLKQSLEEVENKALVLMGVAGVCVCGTETPGEIIKDILVFKCPKCGRRDYKNITDQILKISF